MRKLKPAQLYVVLVLTVIFFLTELILAHLTHALTLLMDSYHMLCNIIALSGCIITVKVNHNQKNRLNLKMLSTFLFLCNVFYIQLYLNTFFGTKVNRHKYFLFLFLQMTTKIIR